MKKVLVPIDFSESSLNALDYGIEIANKLQADLKIIHVKTKKNTFRYTQSDSLEILKNRVEDWLEDIVNTNKDKYRVQNKTFEYCIREGNVFQEITNQAKYDDTTIIVAGTHGASGFDDKWIGSNAYRLVHNSTVPVITVGPERKWNNMRKMLIPISNHRSTRQQVPAAVGLANLFGSKICVLGVKGNNFNLLETGVKAFVKQTVKFIEKNTSLDVSNEIVSGTDKAELIMNFAKNNDVDIIITNVNHSTTPFENLFKPFANQIINNSNCPVLSIPTKDSLYLHPK